MSNSSSVETAEIPDSMQGLRACLRCALVKTYTQFYNSGCENCVFLKMQEEDRRIQEVGWLIIVV
jgi:transcription elongation factor SPT4